MAMHFPQTTGDHLGYLKLPNYLNYGKKTPELLASLRQALPVVPEKWNARPLCLTEHI